MGTLAWSRGGSGRFSFWEVAVGTPRAPSSGSMAGVRRLGWPPPITVGCERVAPRLCSPGSGSWRAGSVSSCLLASPLFSGSTENSRQEAHPGAPESCVRPPRGTALGGWRSPGRSVTTIGQLDRPHFPHSPAPTSPLVTCFLWSPGAPFSRKLCVSSRSPPQRGWFHPGGEGRG